MTGRPPVEAGAVHDTSASALPPSPLTAVGAPGALEGVTASDGAEDALVPRSLLAVTVNV